MLSVLHKNYNAKWKSFSTRVAGHAAEDQKQILDQSTRRFAVVIDEYRLSFISEK